MAYYIFLSTLSILDITTSISTLTLRYLFTIFPLKVFFLYSDLIKKEKKRNIHEVDPQRKSNEINPYLKDTLWSLPHVYSENNSSVLKLCIELPVMIKKNLAIEYCVTNRAETKVVGWKCRPLDNTVKMQLETVCWAHSFSSIYLIGRTATKYCFYLQDADKGQEHDV